MSFKTSLSCWKFFSLPIFLKFISESFISADSAINEVLIKARPPVIEVFNIKKLISFFLRGQILSGVFSLIFLASPILSSYINKISPFFKDFLFVWTISRKNLGFSISRLLIIIRSENKSDFKLKSKIILSDSKMFLL